MTVTTRFAPSPTGFLHVGNLRTALFNHLIAKKAGGQFILRLDDTDPERSKQEYADAIQEDLEWLGITWDRIERQSDRLDRYSEAADQLRAAGRFYEAWETPTELDLKRKKQLNMGLPPVYDRAALNLSSDEQARMRAERGAGVWRFKLDQERIEWEDGILGPLSIDAGSVSDPVLIRADGQVLYTLASVVDDIDMAITHAIRGDDHVNNTPRQIHIFQALGHPPPVYAHLPTVLNEQGEKLSKRNGAKAVTQFRDEGFLPEAMVNYLARLGWSHGDDEIFSREQFVQWFNLDNLGKSAAQFDEAKLRWVNAQHLKAMSVAALADLVQPRLSAKGIATDHRLPDICELFKDRCDTTVELAYWAVRFYQPVTPSSEDLALHVTAAIRPALEAMVDGLQTVDWDKAAVSSVIKNVLQAQGLKMPQLAMPVRVLLLGTPQTPSLDAVISLFKREEVFSRLRG